MIFSYEKIIHNLFKLLKSYIAFISVQHLTSVIHMQE